MAPVGQTSLHSPQRMHSALFWSFFVTSTAMGQTVSHFPHPTQEACSSSIRKKLKRLKRP